GDDGCVDVTRRAHRFSETHDLVSGLVGPTPPQVGQCGNLSCCSLGKKVTHFTAPVGLYGLQGYYFSCRVVINNDGQGKEETHERAYVYSHGSGMHPGAGPKGYG